MSDRRWYIVLRDGDGDSIGAIGPIRQGMPAAASIVQLMLATDVLLATEVDWAEEDRVRAPYFYHSLQVMDLDPTELEAMGL